MKHHFLWRLALALPLFWSLSSFAENLTPADMLSQLNHTIDYLKARQLPGKQWSGAFISDVTQDGMVLIAGKRIGLLSAQKQNEIISNILGRMDSSGNGWDAYPGGPIDMNVTSFTLSVLEQFGMDENHPQVARAWSYYRSHGADKDMATPFKLYLIALGLRDESTVSMPTPDSLITTPTYLYLNKFGIIGDMFYPYLALKVLRKLPDGAWKNHALSLDQYLTQRLHIGPGAKSETIDEARRPPVREVKLVREVLSLTLKNRGTNQAWYGVCFSAFNLLLLKEAQRVGLGDFSEPLQRAWSETQTWNVRSEDGSHAFEPMRSDIWDTAAVLTALSYLPPELRHRIDELKPRDSVRWLINQRNSLHGKVRSLWSFDSTDVSRPDSDDTGAVLFALSRYKSFDENEIRNVIDDGTRSVLRLQNKDGGFAAWSVGVSRFVFWVMEMTIGFPDMADVSQSDITARVVHVFDELKNDGLVEPAVVDKLESQVCRFFDENAENVSNIPVRTFVGHWFSNYIYASAQLISGLKSAHCSNTEAWVAELSNWIVSVQQQDGGWGEDNISYSKKKYVEGKPTLAQTSLAVAGLIDAYELLKLSQPGLALSIADSIEKGLQFIRRGTSEGVNYYEPDFTAILIKGQQYSRYELLPAYIGLYDFARWYQIRYVANMSGE